MSMLDSLSRQQLRVPWTLYAGDAHNIDATPGTDLVRTCPINCKLTAVRASAQAATSATQFIIEILRATTVVATLTSATPYVVGVVVASTNLDIRLSEGDVLTVRIRAVDADGDDLFGLVVEAVLQPVID